MDYEQGPVTMLPDGEYKGTITSVDEYSNPSGANKLIVIIKLIDADVSFKYFFTPGFEVFEQLIRLTGAEPQGKGSFDENKLLEQNVNFETKLTEAASGSEYCNIVAISALAEAANEAAPVVAPAPEPATPEAAPAPAPAPAPAAVAEPAEVEKKNA